VSDPNVQNDPRSTVGHVVIVGCGRVGAGLAERMLAHHHTVSVIDTNRSAFKRIVGLDAEQVEGVGYDRDTLRRAGIDDMRRAAVYERLGIPTVASARLTIDMSMRQLLPLDDAVRWVDPSAQVCLVERPASRALIGTSVKQLESDGTVRLGALRRLGVSVVPAPDLVVQEGDLLYLMVPNDQVAELQASWADAGEGAVTS